MRLAVGTRPVIFPSDQTQEPKSASMRLSLRNTVARTLVNLHTPYVFCLSVLLHALGDMNVPPFDFKVDC